LALNVVGIVCALASEARHLGPTVRLHEPPLQSLADGTLVAVTGMGGSAAAAGSSALIEAGATALASWGMAGGLDPTLGAGAILLPTEVIGSDGRHVNTAEAWRDRLSSAVAALAPVRGGTLLTTPRAIGSVADKAELFRATGAAAVDMEAAAVAQAAEVRGVRFAALKAVSDESGFVMPPLEDFISSDGGFCLTPFAVYIATRPWLWGTTLTLARNSAKASRALCVALEKRVNRAAP